MQISFGIFTTVGIHLLEQLAICAFSAFERAAGRNWTTPSQIPQLYNATPQYYAFPRFLFPLFYFHVSRMYVTLYFNCKDDTRVLQPRHQRVARRETVKEQKKKTFRTPFYDARIDVIYALVRESLTEINHRAASRILR